MKGTILPTETTCDECPRHNYFCDTCRFNAKNIRIPGHVFCTFRQKEGEGLPPVDARNGIHPSKDEFLVLVRKGDPLWWAMKEAHPDAMLLPKVKENMQAVGIPQK